MIFCWTSYSSCGFLVYPFFNICQRPLKNHASKRLNFIKLQHVKEKGLTDRVLLLHHNLFRTLSLGFKVETLLVKQLCYIQTKMYRLYRKWPLMAIFLYTLIYTFLGSIFKPCYIQNCVLMNSVIKRFTCIINIIHFLFFFLPLDPINNLSVKDSSGTAASGVMKLYTHVELDFMYCRKEILLFIFHSFLCYPFYLSS